MKGGRNSDTEIITITQTSWNIVLTAGHQPFKLRLIFSYCLRNDNFKPSQPWYAHSNETNNFYILRSRDSSNFKFFIFTFEE
jgi:hypothetical protein